MVKGISTTNERNHNTYLLPVTGLRLFQLVSHGLSQSTQQLGTVFDALFTLGEGLPVLDADVPERLLPPFPQSAVVYRPGHNAEAAKLAEYCSFGVEKTAVQESQGQHPLGCVRLLLVMVGRVGRVLVRHVLAEIVHQSLESLVESELVRAEGGIIAHSWCWHKPMEHGKTRGHMVRIRVGTNKHSGTGDDEQQQ